MRSAAGIAVLTLLGSGSAGASSRQASAYSHASARTLAQPKLLHLKHRRSLHALHRLPPRLVHPSVANDLFLSPTSPATFFTEGLVLVASVIATLVTWALKSINNPSRRYDGSANSVGREYDAWTNDGILEELWGEHIHLGYYTEAERAKGFLKKDFKQAKYDFIDYMMEWGGVGKHNAINDGRSVNAGVPAKILDVGCGFGGTTRYLAKHLGKDTQVTGITLSHKQVERARELSVDQSVDNVEFEVMDALDMGYPDNSFDVVWACESGEHMPDKQRYVEEMTRVLKPNGTLVIATWCQRDDRGVKFTSTERAELDYLYAEWSHPYFISIDAYKELMEGTGQLTSVQTDDWTDETLPSWRHSIWAGVYNPWPVVFRPLLWWKVVRDTVCIERMHRAFDKGLMQYGMMRAVKLDPYTT